MNKAELYARFDNYGYTIEEISSEDYFFQHSENSENRDKIRHYHNGNVEQYEVVLDGVTYMWYSCLHNVGWQGDVESHSFFCKKKTLTAAEIEDMKKLFTSDAF